MENTLLNLIPSSYIPEVHLSQYDIGRELKFKLMDGNTEYSVPSGATVTVKATKPSGLGFVVSGTFSGNIVTIVNTETMTNESGRFSAELSISSGATLLGTSNFIFNVERSPHPEGTTDGDAETLIPELTLLVNEARSLVEQAEETAQTVTGLEPRVSTAETNISAINTELSVLDARMDTFASLPDGSTSGDAELLDIRVAYDGTTYPSAGDSVRGQVGGLEAYLLDSRKWFDGVNLVDTSKYTVDVKANYNASISGMAIKLDPLTDFYTYNFVPSKDITVACDGAENAYFALSLVKDPIQSEWQEQSGNAYYISGDPVRYRKSENNLPTISNPMTIEAGTRVCVTVKLNETAILLVQNESAKILKNDVLGAEADLFEVEMHSDYFYYYYPTQSGKFIRLKFMHFVNASMNADGWIQRTVDLVDQDKTTVIMPIVIDGEWEMALMLKNRPDFIGCMNHGSEITTLINFYFDGFKRNIVEGVNLLCKEIKVNEKSALYDPNDETTIVGYHYKTYIITIDGIEIRQRVEWITNQELSFCYTCMLPACRGNDYKSEIQVTDKVYDEKTFTEYDCGTTTIDGYMSGISYKGNIANLYGSTSGVSLKAECYIKDEPSTFASFLSNSIYYNKYYFVHNGDGSSVSSGDVWEWVSKYAIKYAE